MKKLEILTNEINNRKNEILYYQINIDNYTLALKKIKELPKEEQDELADFAKQLSELLATEKLEQKKSKIMLSVFESQVK